MKQDEFQQRAKGWWSTYKKARPLLSVQIAVNVTAATPASGSGGGSGRGGGTSCFSPNTRVRTVRGDLRFDDLRTDDYVLTARGTWRQVIAVVRRPYQGPMLDMGDFELVTPGHLFLERVLEHAWEPVSVRHPEFPTVEYSGNIMNAIVETDPDDAGDALDTEHSYMLANGHVVHNAFTA